MNNKLLLALYDRSGLGAYMPVDYKGHELEVAEHMEKFAELIVRECAQFVEDKFDFIGEEIIVKEKMLEHFGVQE